MMGHQILVPVLLSVMGVGVLNYTDESGRIPSRQALSRKWVGGMVDKTGVRARLGYLGREDEYEAFRIRQVALSIVAGAIALVLTLAVTRKFSTAGIMACVVIIGTFMWLDRRLTTEVTRHRLQIESEFASIVEMLTLALSAGETPLGAITRISQRSRSELAREFERVISAVREGKSFYQALDDLGGRVNSIVIRRFVDSLVTAMQRGAPLIEVLQRHAAEARTNQRNILMDKAGKAEISMMVPVVFLILPISVLFALWPSLTHLNLFL